MTWKYHDLPLHECVDMARQVLLDGCDAHAG